MITIIDEKKVMNKIYWKIVPFLLLLYIMNMIDRVNIGFAALTMNPELGISPEAYGFIAGIFFVAYFFFEIPSNLAMTKFGARKWIARILFTWGTVVVLEGFVQTTFQLGVMRTLLGLAEAGFYPCIILYITYWFPGKHQGRAVSTFMLAMCIANIIGGPISGLIMQHISWVGMSGWRWVFILEGIPAVLLGFVALRYMLDGPQNAKWLTKDETAWLKGEFARELAIKKAKAVKQESFWVVLKDLRVWQMAFAYIFYNTTVYGVGFWMPQIIQGLSKMLTTSQIGFVSAVPYIFASAVMVLVARHSDKFNERRFHVALPISIACPCLIALTFTADNLVLSMVLLTISLSAVYAFVGSFWTIPNISLSEKEAAVGLALINSFGALGGMVGPYAVGLVKGITGSTNAGMYVLAVSALLATFAVLALPKRLVTPVDRIAVQAK